MFPEKDSTPFIKYTDKQSEFLSFATIYLCTVKNQSWQPFDYFLNKVQMSSFYRPIVIITFQHDIPCQYQQNVPHHYNLLDTLVDNVKQAS